MSQSPDDHNPDFDFEPVLGLPENLPQGEQLLWQGSPDPRALALDVMHLRSVGSAFAVMAVWWGAAGWHDGVSAGAIAGTVSATILSAAVALGILALSSVLMARGTVYSLTSRRLVIRHGVAMPMSINIPFSKIDSASLSEGKDGFGNVAFMPHARSRTSYVALWPHARPWQIIRPEPMLRCIPDAASVAHLAAQALAASADRTVDRQSPVPAAPANVVAHAGNVRSLRPTGPTMLIQPKTTPVLS
jgi:Bacterial PH domain